MSFNRSAAQWAYDLVMKMDMDEAEVLVPMVLSDLFYNDLRNNKRTVNGAIARIHKSMEQHTRVLVSKGMTTDEEVTDALAYGLGSLLITDEEPLVEFSKAKERTYDRDKSGRFSSYNSLVPGQKKPKKAKHKPGRFEQYGAPALDMANALDARGAGQFSDHWNRAANSANSSSQTMQRIQTGGKAVAAIGVASGSPQLALAGELANVAGTYGPEAEKVIGPSIRRAAYRYRGVTRKPDAELEERVKEVYRTYKPGAELTNDDRRAAARQGAMQYLVGYRTPEGKKEGRIPKMSLAEIQRKSGRITPSEGVMINARGEVVAQAFGHADDHYVPFNLKQLGALNGGEYIRTRTTGGLTAEDIYTGLMAGAKSVTVVSNSGTFTVDFADDLKGVKRYGDKAQSMVSRYGKTLDALRNGQIERVAVSPEVKAEILEEVEADMPSSVYSRAQIQQAYKDKIEEYKATPTLTQGELDDIDEVVEAGFRRQGVQPTEKQYKTMRAAKIEEAMEAKSARIYRLDGDGYSTALDAMQEQYPYFIKGVTFTSSTKANTAEGRIDTARPARDADEFTRQESYRQSVGRQFTRQQDAGYVKPKHNRPEDVLEGYYDTSINGEGSYRQGDKATGKTQADRTDYQNWANNPLNEKAPKPKQAEGGEDAPKKVTPERNQVNRQRANAEFQAKNNAAAVAAISAAMSGLPIPDEASAKAYPLVAEYFNSEDPDMLVRSKIGNPEYREKFAFQAQRYVGMLHGGDKTANEKAISDLRGTIQPTDTWSKADPKASAVKAAGRGLTFNEDGYGHGEHPDAVAVARRKAAGMTAPFDKMFGTDYNSALNAAHVMASDEEFVSFAGVVDDPIAAQALEQVKADPVRQEKFFAAMEGYARMKSLDAVHGKESSPKASAGQAPRPVTSGRSASEPTTPSTPRAKTTGAEEQPKVIAEAPKKPSVEHVMAELNKMVGQEGIKRQVREMSNYIELQRLRKEAGLKTDSVGTHMVFTGNPGTGKTTVARMVGELYAANGVLPSGHVVEVGRAGLVAGYQGQTAEKTMEAIDAARGGVLFIDEAYTLSQDTYGKEAIETIMTEMENSKGDDAFMVIAAGYPKEMQGFLDSNPGLKSRFSNTVNFKDYSPEEMVDIATKMTDRRGYVMSESAVDAAARKIAGMKRGEDFANGREVRNLVDTATKNMATRLSDPKKRANYESRHFNEVMERNGYESRIEVRNDGRMEEFAAQARAAALTTLEPEDFR